jgi:DNA-binding NarL/FixJ family response regulator
VSVPLSLLIVEDHAIIAEALAGSLRESGFEPVEVVGAGDMSATRILGVVESSSPQVVLLDLHLRDFHALPLIGPMVDRGITVVVLTASSEAWEHGQAFRAGASDVIEKSAPFHELVEAIVAAPAGETGAAGRRRDAALAGLRRHRERNEHRLAVFRRLTPSEQDVLKSLIVGIPVEEIARERGVGLHTVRSQVKSVLRKLEVRSQLAAVAVAREAGWPE